MVSSLHSDNLTLPLAQLSRLDLDRAGGKGANLGELVRAGFPVPPGFVVTTAAYDRFVAHNDLGQAIAQALAQPEPGASAIRAAFEAAAPPPEVERAVLAAYEGLGPGPVAVRSSATAEDLPEAAFAGQQDTYLNVLSPQALLEAVRRCWASLWTDRAFAYRRRQGVDQRGVKLAVVIQRMVAAETAGVMFTANPVTGERDEVVIEANPGLGEAIVAGRVTPDHFVLRRGRLAWRIVGRQLGRREVIIRARPGGGTEEVAGPAAGQAAPAPAVADSALRRLAENGLAIQRHFGAPQDVEWAWAGGRLYILQARPITALPAPPPRANFAQRMLAANFGEMLPIRPYPLDLTTWIPALSSAVEPVLQIPGFAWRLGQMFTIDDEVVLAYSGDLPRPTWRTWLAPLTLLGLVLRYDPRRWQSDPLLAEGLARARALDALQVSVLSWQDLLDTLSAAQQVPFLVAGEIRRRYFPRAAFALVRLRLLLGLLGQPRQLGPLISGAANLTVEANQALERLSGQIRANPDLAGTFAGHAPGDLWPALDALPAGRAFLAELRAFLDRYGHRETVISTALQPTWKDAPEVVLGILKGFAAHPPSPGGPPAWQAARDAVLRHPLLHLAPLRSAFLGLLAEARLVVQIREDTHYYATLAMPIIRRAAIELGRRLAQAGLLNAPADVFYLTRPELERIGGRLPPPADLAAELRASVARRQQTRARLEQVPLVDPRLFPTSAPRGSELLRGQPGSPGMAEGPARIIRDGADFDRLLAGDVLVAPYTNPAWTPLFQRAVAVVVDSGTVLSHAAIVAREYGLPAVMSTITGTRTLRDGERIRVDGSQGVVYRA